VNVLIRNQGVIRREQLATLFEPFRSGASSQGGLGLGLYIAKQFVEAHGGTVEAGSTGDKETVFQVTIPRHPHGDGERLKATL
jgi:signal transduction histidine kinase